MITAVFIGIAFGFVLERAGFGRADKLAAQFYLRDLRVFKVMFTAIVTAMLGLVIAAGFGVVNLREASESIASFTWIGPMIAGGVVLGIGFIISGYCPGTSIVSAASGNVDGAFTVAGVVSGTLVYTQLLKIPRFAQFHASGDRGSWFLYDVIPIAPALLAVAIAGFAVLAFLGAEKIDGTRTPRRLAFSAVAALAILSGGQAILPVLLPVHGRVRGQAGSPVLDQADGQAGSPVLHQTIAARDVARIAIEEPWRVRIDGQSVQLDGATYAMTGRLPKLSIDAAPPPPRVATPGGVIAKPKKKSGGCSA